MKKIVIILQAAALLLSWGCTRDDMDRLSRQNEKGFQFEGSSSSDQITSRTIYEPTESALKVTWSDRDQVAIFGVASTGSIGQNLCYQVVPAEKDAGRCTFYPDDASDMILWVNDPSVSFYACYPYKAVNNANATAFPVTLPEQQTQLTGNNTAHLGTYSFMKAQPQTISTTKGEAANVSLNFHNIFSVVEITVKLSETSSIDIPLKEIKLTSTNATALTIPSGSIDLTSPIQSEYTEIPIKVTESLPSVRLLMKSAYILKRGTSTKFYLVVAPGAHTDGELSLEIIASGNSKATVTLPGAVNFKSNRRYKKSVEVTDTDFIQSDPFNVIQESISTVAGQPVQFDFEGMADNIVLYSGEVGYDYDYKDHDRMARAEAMNMSFSTKTSPSGSLNAFNPRYAPVSYSTDFNGTYDEANMGSAIWTDISTLFNFPEVAKATTPSGEYNMVSLYPSDKDALYLRFSYEFDAGTNDIGRSVVEITAFQIMAELTGKTPFKAYGQEADWRGILPVLNPGGAQATIAPTKLTLTASSWKPVAAGKSWAIVKLDVSKFNMGRDQSLSVKNSTDPQPSSLNHTYSKPGIYTAVFVAKTQTLMGEKTETHQVTVTVN